jgi:hypothetical protein
MNLGKYSKFITAAVGQVLTYISLYYGSEHWVAIVVAVAAALGVYAVPNTKPATEEHLLPE